MTHPILNRVPTVVFKGDNDNGRLPQAAPSLSPFGLSRQSSLPSQRFAFRSTIASIILCALIAAYFIAEFLR